MRVRVLLKLAVGIALAASILSANQPGIPEELSDLVKVGIDKILSQDYAGADSLFRLATSKFPNHPLGYLYRAAVMQTKSMDFLDPLDFDAFDSLLAIAKADARKMVDEYPGSPLGYYYLGTAEGYDAYARVDIGNWFAGVTKGLGAASDFKKAVEIDSSFYDAYVGVGTYYYWKSRKTQFLNWALGDMRSEGIRLLEIAATKAGNNRFAALSALAAIYTDKGDFERAIECARKGLQRYPQNRIFLWAISAAQEQSGQFADAAATYRILLADIVDAKMTNPYNEMLCRLNLVKACLAVGQKEGLEAHLKAILAFEGHSFPEDLKKRAQNKFDQARNIQEQLVVK